MMHEYRTEAGTIQKSVTVIFRTTEQASLGEGLPLIRPAHTSLIHLNSILGVTLQRNW